MAKEKGKYEEPFVDTLDLFNKAISDCGLEQFDVNIKLLAYNEQKEITKVVKLNDLVKHMTSEHIVILINEMIFEQLPPLQQKLVIDTALAQIYFDTEKDKIVMVKPDVNTYSLLLQKYGYEEYAILQESIKTLFAKKEEDTAPQS